MSTMSYCSDTTARHVAFAVARDRYAWPNVILVVAILAFYAGGIVLLATVHSPILNFGFHCAHHIVPSCPWYALPKLDRLLHQASGADHRYDARETGVSFLDLLKSYHRNRVDRIFDTNEGNPYDQDGRFSLREFTGAYTDKLLG